MSTNSTISKQKSSSSSSKKKKNKNEFKDESSFDFSKETSRITEDKKLSSSSAFQTNSPSYKSTSFTTTSPISTSSAEEETSSCFDKEALLRPNTCWRCGGSSSKLCSDHAEGRSHEGEYLKSQATSSMSSKMKLPKFNTLLENKVGRTHLQIHHHVMNLPTEKVVARSLPAPIPSSNRKGDIWKCNICGKLNSALFKFRCAQCFWYREDDEKMYFVPKGFNPALDKTWECSNHGSSLPILDLCPRCGLSFQGQEKYFQCDKSELFDDYGNQISIPEVVPVLSPCLYLSHPQLLNLPSPRDRMQVMSASPTDRVHQFQRLKDELELRYETEWANYHATGCLYFSHELEVPVLPALQLTLAYSIKLQKRCSIIRRGIIDESSVLKDASVLGEFLHNYYVGLFRPNMPSGRRFCLYLKETYDVCNLLVVFDLHILDCLSLSKDIEWVRYEQYEGES